MSLSKRSQQILLSLSRVGEPGPNISQRWGRRVIVRCLLHELERTEKMYGIFSLEKSMKKMDKPRL